MNPPSTDPFFNDRKEWSKYKHQILRNYLTIWVRKLSSKHKILTFLDLCAGAGGYATGEDGSPVIAARMNADPAIKRNGAALLVVACEEKPDTAAALREALRTWTEASPPRAVVLDGNFTNLLEEIVARTRDVPTLFFLDPYGMKDVSIDAVRPILIDHAERKEILLRLPPDSLARWAGRMLEDPRDDAHAREIAGFAANLRSCGVDPERARAIAAADLSVEERRAELLAGYLDAFYARFRYVQLIGIHAEYGRPAKYLLLHASDNAHGCAYLNDAASSARDTLFSDTERRRVEKTGQGSLFAEATAAPPASRRPLRAAIIEQLGVAPSPQWVEVRAALAVRFGALYRKRDHEEALRALVAEQIVEARAKGIQDSDRVRLR